MSGEARPAVRCGSPHWLKATRPWWPPVRRREFWFVQALVVGIAAGHALNESLEVLDLHGAEFLPVSLYLLPVVYASLNFGMRGAAPTAVWAFLLTLPNIAIWHEGVGALGELWQATLVLAIGVFIGRRVDRERHARHDAETRERERRASEDRYRGLFDVAADAILLMDAEGRILEANAATATLLDLPAEKLRGARLSEQFPQLWQALTSGSGAGSAPMAMKVGTHLTWVQPLTVPFNDAEGQPRLLAQLHDVTLARERQHLLETFARDTVSAREEERRRVARELHDGPLQSLMLLWRSLDALEQPTQGDGARVVQDARNRAEEAADELRRFSRDLRPSLLDDLGLASALKAEASAYQTRTDIPVDFEFVGAKDVRLPMEIELTLLRICQEALRNVERHARAKHAGVRLEVRSDGYRMKVTDDGVGIDPLQPPTALVRDGRLGVVGMMERARLVGATCQIGSSNPGTTVEVTGTSPRSPAELDARPVS